MPVRVRQDNFTGGEIGPDLYGRTTLEKYASSVKKMLNMVIHPHGPCSNRPGTEYICEVKNSAKATRLIPFQFSTSQAYVIEVGEKYFRYLKDGGQIVYPAGHERAGQIVETVTTYAETDLDLIKYTQSADVLFLTHPSYAPAELSRTDHHLWTLANTSFSPSISAPVLSRSGPGNLYYYFYVTAVTEAGEESLVSNTVLGEFGCGDVLSWTAVTNAVEYNVYIKAVNAGTDFGFWQTLKVTTLSLGSLSPTPDYDTKIPTFRNPFGSAGNYPGCCAFYQQRMIRARTNNAPTTIWGSVTGSFRNMNVSTPLQEDDAYTKTINAQEVNEIRWMVQFKELLVGTSGAEWRLAPDSTTGAVTPSKGHIDPQSYYGSAHLRPIVVGNTVIFLEGSGNVVRDLVYTLERDGYDGDSRSILANHLFEGHTIVDWAYQQHPNSIIWAVRDDGVLLGLTYYRESSGGVLYAWHQHTTDGEFESVACITTSEGVDEVYFVVKRTINGQTKRYIERLTERLFSTDDLEDAFFVDCGKTYDGIPATTISGLSFLEGETVAVLADGVYIGTKVVSSGAITLDVAASVVQVGLPYTSELETLDYEFQTQGSITAQDRPRNVVSVHLQFKATCACSVGPSSDLLTEVDLTETEMFTGSKNTIIDSGDLESSSVLIRNTKPLPITVQAITANIEVGGV